MNLVGFTSDKSIRKEKNEIKKIIGEYQQKITKYSINEV